MNTIRKAASIMILAAASMLAGGLPLSQPITKGDVTIVLGKFSPRLVAQMVGMDPDQMFWRHDCVQVAVSTTDPAVGRYVVTVMLKSGRFATVTTSGPRVRNSQYTLFTLESPDGDFSEVADVWVDKLPEIIPTEHFTDGTSNAVKP